MAVAIKISKAKNFARRQQMKKAVMIGLAVALGIGLGTLVWAQQAGPGGGDITTGPGPRGHMGGFDRGGYWGGTMVSTLTPEQNKQLEQLRLKHWEATKELRISLFTKREELKGLYLRSEPDQKAIEKLQKEIFSLRQKLQEKNFAFRQEMQRIAPELGNYGHRWDDGERGMHRRGPRFDQDRGCQ
jgi:Spy/CpxP family protein refolding chaperone